MEMAARLEHDFMVAPGGSPSQIAFKVTGAKHVQIDSQGSLSIQLSSGRLTLNQPRAYQRINQEERAVKARFLCCSERHGKVQGRSIR